MSKPSTEVDPAKKTPLLVQRDHSEDGAPIPPVNRLSHRTTTRKSAHGSHLFSNFETIDFEEPDGELVRRHYQEQTVTTRLIASICSYVLAFILAVVISLVFAGLSVATEKIGDWRIELYENLFEENQKVNAFLVALGTSLLFAVIPSICIINFAPDAIGSGMTQVIAFLNGAAVLSGVTWRTVLGKCIGVVGLVCSGLYSGIDGPMAKIGSSIAIISTEAIQYIPFIRRPFYGERESLSKMDDEDSTESVGATNLFNVLEHKNLRLFATLGAAASIAAIFRAPVGGAVFALEEATSFWDPHLMTRTVFTTTTAFMVVSAVLLGSGVNLLDRLFGGIALLFPTDISCTQNFNGFHLLSFVVIAVLAAGAGILHNYLLSFVQLARKRTLIDRDMKHPSILNKLWRILEVVVVCVITMLLVVLVPMASEQVDTCSPLFNTVKHALTAAPFVNCYNQIQDVCLPTALDETLTENVLLSYQILYDNQCSSQRTLTTRSVFLSSLSEAANTTTPTPANGTSPAPPAPPAQNSTVRYLSNVVYSGTSDFLQNGVNATFFADMGLKVEVLPAGTSALAKRSESVSSTSTSTNVPISGVCYWELRSLFWTTPEKQLKLLLLRGVNGVWSWKTLVIFALLYWFLSTLTYYIALPTDVVVPNLIIGAALGRLAGVFVDYIGSKLGLFVQDPGFYALLAMAAFWASTSRLVLTVTVIAFELTGDYVAVPALILVTWLSAWISSGGVGESIYHTEMENNEVPFLPHEPYHLLRTKKTRDIMTRKVCCVEENMKLDSLNRFVNEPHLGFPVVQYYDIDRDADGHIDSEKLPKPIGFVRRDRLRAARDAFVNEEGDLDRLISLRPIMNTSPFVVNESTSASKVFTIFRQLGLRQILVVDNEGFMVGLVTREDLLRPKVEREEEERKKNPGLIGIIDALPGAEEQHRNESRAESRSQSRPVSPASTVKDLDSHVEQRV
ncbi:chloride channel [Polychytrium aggregatum]|uniref:chloride channel n=1 Tax=Polychytrium aggregatum TaxID=110093 RepID=UPI0022FE1C51|nr:chloride channel [Polychytrium aggregatum]KAI9206351.1 chloride channel [Polychytrium aggregatum]